MQLNVLLLELLVQSILILAQTGVQVTFWRWTARAGWSAQQRRALAVALLVLDVYLAISIAISTTQYAVPLHVAPGLQSFFRVPSSLWLFGSVGSFAFYLLWRLVRGFLLRNRTGDEPDLSRRHAIQTIGSVVVAAPAVTLALGAAIGRTEYQIREVEIPVNGLHPDLNGLRLVQISDLHLGDFLSERELARAIDAANTLRGNLGFVTGDLITKAGDPLPAAIRQIARFKTDAGVLGCMGNHEIYSGAEKATEQLAARVGIRFLRMGAQVMRFGAGQFNIAGVDFQPSMHRDLYLAGTEALIVPGMPNFLLSHNPDVFPVAVAKGFDVTLAGHTHGGQVTIEILNRGVNFARFYTPFVAGLYSREGKSIYVTRGIGTIGVPSRVGALPEITLIKLKSLPQQASL